MLLGITTGPGGLACMIVAVGAGSAAGGSTGGKLGEWSANKIREVIVGE